MPGKPGAPPTDWHSLVAACGSRAIQAVLQGVQLEMLEASRIVLRVPPGLMRTAEIRREEITQALSKAAGRMLALELLPGEIPANSASHPSHNSSAPPASQPNPPHPSSAHPGSSSTPLPAPRHAPQPLPASSMSDHPLVRQAAELLNARLIRVERRESPNG